MRRELSQYKNLNIFYLRRRRGYDSREISYSKFTTHICILHRKSLLNPKIQWNNVVNLLNTKRWNDIEKIYSIRVSFVKINYKKCIGEDFVRKYVVAEHLIKFHAKEEKYFFLFFFLVSTRDFLINPWQDLSHFFKFIFHVFSIEQFYKILILKLQKFNNSILRVISTK